MSDLWHMKNKALIDESEVVHFNLMEDIRCLSEEVDRIRDDSEKLLILADACSDKILGGECGWENMDFKEFVALVRKSLSI